MNSSERLIIFGAGKQAEHAIVTALSNEYTIAQIALFDDKFPLLQKGPMSLPILGNINDGIGLSISEKSKVFIAFGSDYTTERYELFTLLKKNKSNCVNLIHPNTFIAENAVLGSNLLIMPGCIVNYNATLKSLCTLFSGVTVEHDSSLGVNSTLGPAAVLSGNVRIERNVFIGTGAVFLPGVSVGQNSIIGAGSVVTKRVPSNVTAKGIPAQFPI